MAGGTNRWARAAFNDDSGWPSAVSFFRERLFYARGRTLYGSVVGLYDDFQRLDGPDVTKETALVLPLASDRVDLVRWLSGLKGALLVGSSRAELSVQQQTLQQVFAADNVTADPQTELGSTLLEPLRVGNVVLFIQRSGRKMQEMKYQYSDSGEGFTADEITVLAEHILASGVVDMDYQQEPDSVVWCVLGNGSLAALTYNRARGVVAWAPHFIGDEGFAVTADGIPSGYGFVESVASISSPDGTRDDLWLVVRRTIDGETRRYIEIMESNMLAQDNGLAEAFYLDSGITRPAGSPTSTVTGLDHLEGATVQILADGNPHPDRVVTDGAVDLQFPASVIHVGFNAPARLKTMRVEGGSQGGTNQTKMKAIAECFFRLNYTLGGRAGPDFDRLDAFTFTNPNDPVGTPLPLFSGDKVVDWPATYDTDGYVCIVQDQPLPMTLVAIVPRMEVSEDQ